jgi:3-methyladenine DNA glycosylase/8-oxoguanine DNA glycosylase
MKPRFRYDPEVAVAHLSAVDAKLAGVIAEVGPFALELRPAKSLFEALLRSIMYQHLHGKAAATIHGRVLTVLKKHGGVTANALAAAPDDELRGPCAASARGPCTCCCCFTSVGPT